MKKKLRLNIEEIRIEQFVILPGGAAKSGSIHGHSGYATCGEMTDTCGGSDDTAYCASAGVGASAPCRYCLPVYDTFTCVC